jgi:hypothetical protein
VNCVEGSKVSPPNDASAESTILATDGKFKQPANSTMDLDAQLPVIVRSPVGSLVPDTMAGPAVYS